MWEGKERADWSRISAVLALTVNVNRDPKKGRAATPADFDPFAQRQEVSEKPLPIGIGVLKDVFIHRRLPQEVKDGPTRT